MSEQCFILVRPAVICGRLGWQESVIGQSSRRGSYWTELQKRQLLDRASEVSYYESSRHFRSLQEEAVPEDGESTVNQELAMGRRQFGNARKGTSAVGSRYQRTAVGQQDERNKCVCIQEVLLKCMGL
jgi:hypothetical protein